MPSPALIHSFLNPLLTGLRPIVEDFWRNKSGVSSLRQQSSRERLSQTCSREPFHAGRERGQHPNMFSSALARDCIPPRQIRLPILAWAARRSRVAPVGQDLVVVALVSLFFFFLTLGYSCPSAYTPAAPDAAPRESVKPCCTPRGVPLWSVMTSPASPSPLLSKKAHV